MAAAAARPPRGLDELLFNARVHVSHTPGPPNRHRPRPVEWAKDNQAQAGLREFVLGVWQPPRWQGDGFDRPPHNGGPGLMGELVVRNLVNAQLTVALWRNRLNRPDYRELLGTLDGRRLLAYELVDQMRTQFRDHWAIGNSLINICLVPQALLMFTDSAAKADLNLKRFWEWAGQLRLSNEIRLAQKQISVRNRLAVLFHEGLEQLRHALLQICTAHDSLPRDYEPVIDGYQPVNYNNRVHPDHRFDKERDHDPDYGKVISGGSHVDRWATQHWQPKRHGHRHPTFHQAHQSVFTVAAREHDPDLATELLMVTVAPPPNAHQLRTLVEEVLAGSLHTQHLAVFLSEPSDFADALGLLLAAGLRRANRGSTRVSVHTAQGAAELAAELQDLQRVKPKPTAHPLRLRLSLPPSWPPLERLWLTQLLLDTGLGSHRVVHGVTGPHVPLLDVSADGGERPAPLPGWEGPVLAVHVGAALPVGAAANVQLLQDAQAAENGTQVEQRLLCSPEAYQKNMPVLRALRQRLLDAAKQTLA